MFSLRALNGDLSADPYDLTPLQQMAASCTGAMITSVFVTPLDVVKIRLQTQQKAFMKNKCYLFCNGLMDHLCPCFSDKNGGYLISRPTVRFNGTVDAFVKIVQIEGLASLWSGLPPTLLMAVPATMIYFTAYEQLRNYFTKMFEENKGYVMLAPMIAGSTARILAASVISPLELVRTKMQSKKMVYRDVHKAVRDLVRHEGFGSLWRGYIPSVMRDVPFSAIYWSNYEYLKATYGGPTPTFGFSFLAGATSGGIAAVLTLPFDVVKTHRQIELGEKEIYSAKSVSRTRFLDPPQKSAKTYTILKRIYYQSGPSALFTGIVPRVIKVAPACAIMISSFEYGKAFFRKRNEEKIKSED
uniref:Solute carrier family 25 member 40 n=1 Tax=Strigamia maritima TaxID=126957 RepID=T1J4G9_STRMM